MFSLETFKQTLNIAKHGVRQMSNIKTRKINTDHNKYNQNITSKLGRHIALTSYHTVSTPHLSLVDFMITLVTVGKPQGSFCLIYIIACTGSFVILISKSSKFSQLFYYNEIVSLLVAPIVYQSSLGNVLVSNDGKVCKHHRSITIHY